MNREFQVRMQADMEMPALLVTNKKYDLTITEGETFQTTFMICAEDESKVQGVVTSNNNRILFAKSAFSGLECKITFGIDTKGLTAGEAIEGSMMIISNLGEVRIPVNAAIVEKMVSDYGNQVRTLEDFAAVCHNSMYEGFRMFKSPAFINILTGENAKYRALYKGLAKNPVTYQSVEEFLVSTGMKKKVELSLDERRQDFGSIAVSMRDTLNIIRSEWGNVHLDVEVVGDFIEVSKKTINEEDFIGKVYPLEYLIRQEKLEPWKKDGIIRLRGLHEMLEFHVSASTGESVLVGRDIEKHFQISTLMRLMVNYKLGKIDENTWYMKSRVLIEDLCISYPSNVSFVLYKAYLAMMRGKNSEAMRIVWPIKDGTLRIAYQEEKAAYLYIAKKINLLPEEDRNILPELQRVLYRVPADFTILYMCMDEEAQKGSIDDMKMLQQMELCYDAGCNSPFLYLQAWSIIKNNEGVLRKLSPFYLSVLIFAQKHGILTERALRRGAFLSDNVKRFSSQLYRFLCKGYDEYGTDDILEAICRLIIKGKPRDKAYFPWYQLAIERNLRITRIYEYYMETFAGDVEEPLPMSVLMYFAYNDTLADRVKALLYASIIRHRVKMPNVYEMYAAKIKKFTESMLEKGQIDENLAVLYEKSYGKDFSGRTAALLSQVMFRTIVKVGDLRARNVVVVYDALRKEETYPVVGGRAYIDLYDQSATILLEDEMHRRFEGTIDQMTRLMNADFFAKKCHAYNVRHTGLLLYSCGSCIRDIDINEEKISEYLLAMDHEQLTLEYRNEIRKQLMAYYMNKRGEKSRTEFVYSMDVPTFVEADKTACVTLLIEEGRFVEAFAALSEFGYEHISPMLMLRMTTEMIGLLDGAYNDELLAMVVNVVRGGKYDENVLSYMRSYYDGPVLDLCALHKMLSGFNMDTYSIEEKILKQCVFVHTFPRQEVIILKNYLRSQGNIGVITQYLSYICRQTILGRRKLAKEICEMIESCYNRQWKLGVACQIMLLKYYANMQKDVSEDGTTHKYTKVEKANMERILENLISKNLKFAYFRDLPDALIEKYQIEDKVFIEEQFAKGSIVYMHYCIAHHAEEDEKVWRVEPMRDMYHGIFSKEMMLFYGEKLTYHLEVIENGVTRVTEDKEIVLHDIVMQGNSKYKLLNQMLKLQDENEQEALRSTVEKYLKQEASVDALLKLM